MSRPLDRLVRPGLLRPVWQDAVAVRARLLLQTRSVPPVAREARRRAPRDEVTYAATTALHAVRRAASSHARPRGEGREERRWATSLTTPTYGVSRHVRGRLGSVVSMAHMISRRAVKRGRARL